MAQFSETEQKIINIFKEKKNNNEDINFMNKIWKVIKVAKPTTSRGEPKTDVYILLEDNIGNTNEIKISIKQSNADFLENKLQAPRAEELFGIHWSNIIKDSTESIKEEFEKKTLIFKNKEGRTEKGAITLGWKFELLNKSGGKLSGNVKVSSLEVYSGQSLAEDKRNAYINGEVIQNSGVANYILIVNNEAQSNINNILESLIPIEKFSTDNSSIYFACKALNLRTKSANKWDGNRPLAVYVDWSIENGKLKSTIEYNDPLYTKGNAVATNLLTCLKELDITDTDDIDSNNSKSNIN